MRAVWRIPFVTNHPELSPAGYTVHAQDYIIKPVEQERIDAANGLYRQELPSQRAQEHRCSAVFPSRTDTSSQKYCMGGKQPQQHRLYITDKRKAMRLPHLRRWKTPAGRGF